MIPNIQEPLINTEVITSENKGYSFLVLKDSEDYTDLNLIIPTILQLASGEIVDELDSIELLELLLEDQKSKDIDFVISNYKKLKLMATLGETYFECGNHEKLTFWAINYRDHLGKFYYDDMLQNAITDFSVYLLEYDGPQEDLGKLLKILKGQSTINIKGETLTQIQGKGIRGMFDIYTTEINEVWVTSNIENAELASSLLGYVEQEGKPVVFYDLPSKIQSLIYNTLPRENQIELVKHKIHSPDDIETVFDSLFYLLQSKLETNAYFDVYETAKTNKTLATQKLFSYLNI